MYLEFVASRAIAAMATQCTTIWRMAKMLLNLRSVPEQESDGLKRALDEQGLDWYEVPPGIFIVSAGSIWIRHNHDYPRAKEIFDCFQEQYAAKARAEDPGIGWIQHFRARPAYVIGYSLAALLVLLLFSWPVLHLLIG